MTRNQTLLPSNGCDGFAIFELAESLRVVQCFHKDVREFLFIFGALVLRLTMF